jgi:hypothetical protein
MWFLLVGFVSKRFRHQRYILLCSAKKQVFRNNRDEKCHLPNMILLMGLMAAACVLSHKVSI